MKNKINETIIDGRKFRRLIDADTKNWEYICLTPFGISDDFQERIKSIYPKHYKRKDT